MKRDNRFIKVIRRRKLSINGSASNSNPSKYMDSIKHRVERGIYLCFSAKTAGCLYQQTIGCDIGKIRSLSKVKLQSSSRVKNQDKVITGGSRRDGLEIMMILCN